MVDEHDRLVGGLIRQARSQADCIAGEDGFRVWLFLLMQEGVAQHLYRGRQCKGWSIRLGLLSLYTGRQHVAIL